MNRKCATHNNVARFVFFNREKKHPVRDLDTKRGHIKSRTHFSRPH
jgi:hypothetical protein